FSEAAMVGALADWFAVVALFKKPMGLAIPHTAIIPENKIKIADNLAEFVREKFLNSESLVKLIRKHDPAEKISEWLMEPENTELLGNLSVKAIAGAFDFVDDNKIQHVINNAMRTYIKNVDLSKSAGELLDTLTSNNRHQALLDEGIDQASILLKRDSTQQYLEQTVTVWLKEEHEYIEKMIPTETVARWVASNLVKYCVNKLQEINDDHNHELRIKFNEGMRNLIERMKHDPEIRRKGEEIKMQLLNNEALNTYMGELWTSLKDWLRNDLDSPHSIMRKKIVETGQWIGEKLANDPTLRQSINSHFERAAQAMAPDLSHLLTNHISSTVKSWDSKDMSRQIELSIGKDLQFIRLSGTIVGGFLGIIIYAISSIL
ncbi:MAG TPA: DUF445 domain-containing protein, partial [Candidatus Paceibacterota bacterium]